MFASVVAVKKWQPSSAATAGRATFMQYHSYSHLLVSLNSGLLKLPNAEVSWIREIQALYRLNSWISFYCNAFQLCVSLWLRWRHVSCWGHVVNGGAQKCWSGEVLKGRKITAKGLSVILDTWFGGKRLCLEWYTLQGQTLRQSFLKEIGPRQSKEVYDTKLVACIRGLRTT